MMIAGMAYIATTSHGSQSTLPAISLDEFSTKLGQRCHYADFKQFTYLGFSRTEGPTYIWNRNTDRVLVIQDTDSLLLDVQSQTGQRLNINLGSISAQETARLIRNWQIDRLACLGIYSHLMEADQRSFVTSLGNPRLRSLINQPHTKGYDNLLWEISPHFDALSCVATMQQGDTLKISWAQWSTNTDSIRWAPMASINQEQMQYYNVTATHQISGSLPEF